MSGASRTGRRVAENISSTLVNSDDEACQLDMFAAGRGGALDDRWATVMLAVRAAVNELEPQNVAYDLETTASGLAHALAERDRHFPAKWLLYLIEKSRKGPVIAGYLAAVAGYELHAHRRLTPEEELTRLKDSIAKNLGPEMQRVITRDAFGGGR